MNMVKWKIGLVFVLLLMILITASSAHKVELVGSYFVEGGGIDVSDNYAYIISDKLYIIDISTPSKPFMVGQCNVSGSDIAASNSYVYVIGGEAYGGMHIIDVSDPYKPIKVGQCRNITGWSIAISGNHAYGASHALYGHSRIPGLSVVDISDPYNPQEIRAEKDEYDEGIQATQIVAFGNYIYVADCKIEGLVIINVLNPANPIRISQIYEIGDMGVAVSELGKYVYLSGYDLHVVDVTIPSNPIVVAEYRLGGGEIAVGGDYSYTNLEEDFIDIFNISDPRNPRYIGFGGPAGGGGSSTYCDVAASSNYAYAVGRYAGLDIYTVIETGSFHISTLPSGAVNIYIDGEYTGTTPQSDVWHGWYQPDVPVGSHTIKLTKSGYNDWETTKYVHSEETVEVSATLSPETCSISISSAPAGAEIYLDGIYEGTTPKTILDVSIDSHTIELTKNGYHRWSTSVYVTAGDTETISASMDVIAVATPATISTKSPIHISTPKPTHTLAQEDSDGDGVSDNYDYAPYDPNVQSKGDIKTPGFEVIFVIAGLLAVAYLLRRRG